MTREEVISQAVDQCLKELYKYAVPKITWEKFIEQNKLYSKCSKEWQEYHNAWINREKNPKLWESFKENYKLLEWENKSEEECIGPKPFEFYYLPECIIKDIHDFYVDIYKFDSQQELLSTIEILKNYCKNPIITTYTVESEGNRYTRGYDHPNNLEKEIKKKLEESPIISVPPSNKEEYYTELSKKLQNKFFEFLDKAGNFYNWNRDLNTFSTSVYLGPAPSSNKERVIKNWKQYKNKDIKINEEQIKKEYYEEDFN